MGKLTTFGINSICDNYIEFNSLDNITEIYNLIKANTNFYILGGGSNTIFVHDFKGLVLKVQLKGKSLLNETESSVLVESYAGENWDEWVAWTLENGYYGLENLTAIPGEVGACPIQNIGAYGAEVKDFIEEVEFLNLETGKIQTLTNAECAFGYRDSIFKQTLKSKVIILKVRFRLSKLENLNIAYSDIANEISKQAIQKLDAVLLSNIIRTIRERKLPDPKQLGNAGSFFKNPIIARSAFTPIIEKHPTMPHYDLPKGEVKIAAGWLIEQCGWKGKSIGGCAVHENQALVIVNKGNANYTDITSIVKKIQDDVYLKFGVKISPEVNMVGI